jgi:shikimate kinase
MQRVLLTGVSGVGKSTLIAALQARGYRAVDTDEDGWSELRRVDDRSGVAGSMDLLWREDRIAALLSGDSHTGDHVLFVSGCAPNQVQFYPMFEHVVLLSAPSDVLLERLANRTNNPYGKRADEVARILEQKQTIEPLLRRSADLELDTCSDVGELVDAVLRHIGR